MKNQEGLAFFFNPKKVRALVSLLGKDSMCVSDISQAADTTYAHTCHFVSEFEERGYITREQRGRKKITTLTDSGEELATVFNEAFKLLGENSRNRESQDVPDYLNKVVG